MGYLWQLREWLGVLCGGRAKGADRKTKGWCEARWGGFAVSQHSANGNRRILPRLNYHAAPSLVLRLFMLSARFRPLPLPHRTGLALALALALACAIAATPVFAQDRTCSRMKALTVSATTGFANLSGPEVARNPAWTTIQPTQDLIPMMGECQLRTPAQVDGARATLTCTTPLLLRADSDLVKDLGVLAGEFGKCLGTAVQDEARSTASASGRRWVLDGPSERPWQLTLSLNAAPASGRGDSKEAPRQLEMVLTSKASTVTPSK